MGAVVGGPPWVISATMLILSVDHNIWPNDSKHNSPFIINNLHNYKA